MSGWFERTENERLTSWPGKTIITFRVTYTHSLVAGSTFAPARQAVPARILLR